MSETEIMTDRELEAIRRRLSQRVGLPAQSAWVLKHLLPADLVILVEWEALAVEFVVAELVTPRRVALAHAAPNMLLAWHDEAGTRWCLSAHNAGRHSLTAIYVADALIDPPGVTTARLTKDVERMFRKAVGAKGRGGPRFRDIRSRAASDLQ